MPFLSAENWKLSSMEGLIPLFLSLILRSAIAQVYLVDDVRARDRSCVMGMVVGGRCEQVIVSKFIPYKRDG